MAPLPVRGPGRARPSRALAVLVVDETRHSGGVSEAVVATLVDAGVEAPSSRVTSADSFIPLGPAADAVLLQEDEILAAARARADSDVKSTPCASGSSPEKLTVLVARRM